MIHHFAINGGTVFAGYSNGETWNGWARPYFDRATAEAILNKFGIEWTYSDDDEAFTISDVPGDEPQIVSGVLAVANGRFMVLYPIGTGSWAWERVS